MLIIPAKNSSLKSNARAALGKAGENIVARQLEREGFKILEKNYKRQYGEIDLIAGKKELIVFVEVKMRRNINSELEHLVPESKQKKIALVAKEYMARNNVCEKTCRFDVALIKGTEYNHELQYISNAFYEPEF